MLKYLKTAISDYKKVASPFASSRFAARRIVSDLKPEYKYVVEYGSGDGAITKVLLKALPKDGKLVAVEINQDFVAALKEIKDDRLVVISGDVVEIASKLNTLGLPQVDVVISGIPFSFFNKATREKIIEETHRHLAPGGRLIVYQVSSVLRSTMKKVFGKKVKLKIEPRNFPPYFIMIADR